MDRKQLIKELASRMNCRQSDAEVFIETLSEIMADCVESDEELKVRGFGTLYTIPIPERKGYDNHKKSKVIYPATKKVIFKVAGNIKGKIKYD